MITMVSALVVLYGLSSIHRKIGYVGLAIVAVWGLAALIYQMWKQYDHERKEKYREETKRQINDLLAEGQRLAVSIKTRNPNCDRRFYPENRREDWDDYNLIVDWTKRAEDVLRKRLNEGYVERFHFGGSVEQDKTSMTLFKTFNRLETLASFLAEV